MPVGLFSVLVQFTCLFVCLFVYVCVAGFFSQCYLFFIYLLSISSFAFLRLYKYVVRIVYSGF